MELIYLIFFFVIGLFFGSFFCVVGTRLGRNENFIKGRSYCETCHHPLSFLDMIPLLSYLFLKGRCRYCKEKILPLSFFIELATGILFMISYYSFSFSFDLVLALSAVSLTMIIFASDLLYYIIPDNVLIFFALLFFVIQIFRLSILPASLYLLSALSLFLFMYALFCFGNLLFHKETLGGGDIKLMFVIGLVFDPFLGILTVFLASFIALPVSLFLLIKKKERMIPFGPFLLISFLILLFSKLSTVEILEFLRLYIL